MKTDIEDEETVGLPGAVRSRISRLAKALKWKLYHLLRAQGGPRGGPLVVPPILDTTLINLMQSSRNDLTDIFMRDTVNSDFKLGLIVILKKATSFEILIEKSKTFSKN